MKIIHMDNLLVLINKGEVTGAVNIDNTYEFASSHYNDFKDLRDDEDIVINQEWISNNNTFRHALTRSYIIYHIHKRNYIYR